MEKITHLILSGGGTHGVVFVGCLKYLYSNNIINNITHISCSSIGSFIAVMIILKLTVEEIEDVVRKTLLYDKACFIPKNDCWNILTTMGLTNTEHVVEPLKELLYKKYGKDIQNITFADIKINYGINLYISVTNISKSCNEIFSYENTPTINVLTACKASMSLPILYEPQIINNNYYYDGGLTNNFPISIFEEVPDENKLGLALNGNDGNDGNKELEEPEIIKEVNMYDIILKLLATMKKVLRKETILKNLNKDFVIVYEDIPTNWMQTELIKTGIQVFNLTSKDIDLMIEYGYNKTKDSLIARMKQDYL